MTSKPRGDMSDLDVRTAHIVVLGNFFLMGDGKYNLTVQHQDGSREGWDMGEPWWDFLSTINPLAHANIIDDAGAAFVEKMAGLGAVRLVSELPDADIYFVPRKAFSLDSETEEGYSYLAEDGSHFHLEEFGARILNKLSEDMSQTVSTAAVRVLRDTMGDEDDRKVVEAEIEKRGVSAEAIALEEALVFMKRVRDSGVASLEPR